MSFDNFLILLMLLIISLAAYLTISCGEANKQWDNRCVAVGGVPYHTRDNRICLNQNTVIQVPK